MSSETTECDIVILVLMGIPGAGKSTFVDRYIKYLEEQHKDIGAVHVCYDQLIPLEVQKETVNESGLWKKLRTQIVESVDIRIHEYKGTACELERNDLYDKVKMEGEHVKRVLIIDDNNQLSSMRYPYFQIARKHEIGFCQLHLNVELQTALRLNKDRPGEVPESVIHNMASSIEPPNPLTNNWEKFSFSMNVAESDEINFDLIHNVVATAFKYPEKCLSDNSEERELDRIVCSANLVHQADKHLRSIINKKMKSFKDTNMEKEEMRVQSKNLYNIKQEILEDLKTGFTKLDRQLVEEVTQCSPESAQHLASALSQLFDSKISIK